MRQGGFRDRSSIRQRTSRQALTRFDQSAQVLFQLASPRLSYGFRVGEERFRRKRNRSDLETNT